MRPQPSRSSSCSLAAGYGGHGRGVRQRRLDHADSAGGGGALENRTADDPCRQPGETDTDEDCCGERSEQRNPRAAAARGGSPGARSSPQSLSGPERPREQTTDDGAGNGGGRDPHGKPSGNRQAGPRRHRREAEEPENRRCQRAGKDEYRHHSGRGVADQTRSPQGGVGLDLRLFLLVAAVGTGDFLDGVGHELGHDHIV